MNEIIFSQESIEKLAQTLATKVNATSVINTTDAEVRRLADVFFGRLVENFAGFMPKLMGMLQPSVADELAKSVAPATETTVITENQFLSFDPYAVRDRIKKAVNEILHNGKCDMKLEAQECRRDVLIMSHDQVFVKLNVSPTARVTASFAETKQLKKMHPGRWTGLINLDRLPHDLIVAFNLIEQKKSEIAAIDKNTQSSQQPKKHEYRAKDGKRGPMMQKKATKEIPENRIINRKAVSGMSYRSFSRIKHDSNMIRMRMMKDGVNIGPMVISRDFASRMVESKLTNVTITETEDKQLFMTFQYEQKPTFAPKGHPTNSRLMCRSYCGSRGKGTVHNASTYGINGSAFQQTIMTHFGDKLSPNGELLYDFKEINSSDKYCTIRIEKHTV